MQAPRPKVGKLLLGGVAMVIGVTLAAYASPASISLSSVSRFPEGLTATADGTLYASSLTQGGIVRVKAGSDVAEPWIKPGAFDTRSTFGVLADERSGLLWVCSNDATPLGVAGPNAIEGAFVKGFDLATGEGKVSLPLPAKPSLCNDLTIGPDGALYVSNTLQPQILRLSKGASELEVWVQDDRLKGGLDGLAFGRDGALYVNTFLSGELFRIEAKGGAAGAVTKLRTSRPLTFPDGFKADGTGFLMVEGAGPLSRVTVTDDLAEVETVKDFAGPTGLARVGDTVWVAEGQLDYLMNPEKKGQTPTFQLRAVRAP
ncbi:hypothetical protein [Methylobacterium sp. 77]|uniref:SMP-30/gluconolactonase/LRE family protein n=1 Tax=Methylobacterium sp. 77 TaxID=1101192 RepID=UPI00039BF86A|nr:hypothetical protein [Methylobacterium sp. 77]